MKTKKVDELSKLRNCFKALIIEILEGDGTIQRPREIVRYVLHPDGSILGKIDQNWMTREIL